MKRYPFGMPAWLYWVLAVVLLGMIGNIPFIGPVITFVGLIAAFVYFFVFVKKEKDRRYRAYKPTPVTGQADLGVDRLEVVGESHHLLSISQAVSAGGRDLTAVLVWEPRNPHSSNRSAVRVELVADGRPFMCGYVPSGLSAQVAPIVKANAERGLATVSPARVFGGTQSKPNYGVILGTGVQRSSRSPRFSPS